MPSEITEATKAPVEASSAEAQVQEIHATMAMSGESVEQDDIRAMQSDAAVAEPRPDVSDLAAKQASDCEPKRRAKRNTDPKMKCSTMAHALSLRLKGNNYEAIAVNMGLSESGIKKCMKHFAPIIHEMENVESYREIKSNILSAMEMVLLKEMSNPEKLAKASINNLAYAFQQINNANRLEQGQSTANVHSHSSVTLREYGDSSITIEPS